MLGVSGDELPEVARCCRVGGGVLDHDGQVHAFAFVPLGEGLHLSGEFCVLVVDPEVSIRLVRFGGAVDEFVFCESVCGNGEGAAVAGVIG